MTDTLSAYICAAYGLIVLTCVMGAFNIDYDANLLQRLALAMVAVWCVWRIQLVYAYQFTYPNEPVVATAIMLYAIGSIMKTLRWKKLK